MAAGPQARIILWKYECMDVCVYVKMAIFRTRYKRAMSHEGNGEPAL